MNIKNTLAIGGVLTAVVGLSACQSMNAVATEPAASPSAQAGQPKERPSRGERQGEKGERSAHQHSGKVHRHHDRQGKGDKQGRHMATKSFTSIYDFNTTTTKISNTLTERGMTIFSVIDHQAAATKAGLSMQPATVIVFGAPKAGTPLMVKDPKFALQLPLKALITKENGKVIVVMNDTRHMIAHSDITWQDVENSLAKAEALIENTVTK